MIYLLLFWEKKSMRTLLRKNLIAHKQTNQLTSIIYALSLGCIIFIIVSASLEIQQIDDLSTVRGVDIDVKANSFYINDEGVCINCLLAENIDPLLLQYESHIKSFGYETVNLEDVEYNPQNLWSEKTMKDESTMYTSSLTYVRGLSPAQVFEEILDVKYHDRESGLSLIEQLYTPRGSQGAGTYYQSVEGQYANADPKDYTNVFYLFGGWGNSIHSYMYKFRPLWTLNSTPSSLFGQS